MTVELRVREGDQPLPTPNDGPDILALVAADFRERRELGIRRYGAPLQPHNGRRSDIDAYEEVLDLAAYIRQMIEERTGPTLPCEKCGEANSIAVVVWHMPQHRITFLVCDPCRAQYMREGRDIADHVHTFPLYPPLRDQAPPAGVDLADEERPETTYPAEVFNGLGGPVGELAALLAPLTAEALAVALRAAAAEIDAEATRLGRPLTGAVASQYSALATIARCIIDAREESQQ
ncbi:hypothetical protein ACQP25_44850 (plasmid) [Microtetraspora malaysiensis]|uniref:hypothetical protein n=1 Tax=Microtetraspora malaysiensis TaxID=161358 RepID=UPI003D947187